MGKYELGREKGLFYKTKLGLKKGLGKTGN
jgi:hypothetical protein